jgi:hypothetical protein
MPGMTSGEKKPLSSLYRHALRMRLYLARIARMAQPQPYTAQRGYTSYSDARAVLRAARKRGHLGWIARHHYGWQVRYYRVNTLFNHVVAQGSPIASSKRRAVQTKWESFDGCAIAARRKLIESKGGVAHVEVSHVPYQPALYTLYGYSLQQLANHLCHEEIYAG